MDLNTLVKIEHDTWKERMMDESQGVYILIYFGFFMSVLLSSLYGFSEIWEDSFGSLVGIVFFTGLMYQLEEVYLSFVKESGKRVNIFEKYIYMPVSLKMLRRAKLIVLAKSIAVPALAGQLAAILVRALDSGDFCDWSVYLPLITAVGFILEKAAKYRQMCRKLY